jgi:response regulator of citrate/malate metabolism
MKKNQSILFVSLGLIGLGIYYFYKQSKQPSLAKNPSSDGENTETTKSDWDKILKRGSQGIEVETLQKALKQLEVDGDFGAKTETRLKRVMGISQTTINQYNEFIRNQKAKKEKSKNVFQPFVFQPYNSFKP